VRNGLGWLPPCLLACSLLGSPARADEPPGEPREEAPLVVTKAPKLIRFVEAEYPADKKVAGVEATVTLSLELDAEGHVGEVQVVGSAGPDFDAAAVAAARRFVFSPAEVDGKPGPVRITYRYTFQIRTQMVGLGPQVNFEGVVRERYSKRPLAGVRVRVTDVDRDAITDELGRFSFIELPLGRHLVELTHERLVTVSTEETLEAGKKKAVVYRVEEKQEGVDEERVTRAPRIKREAVETTIRAAEARRVPGTQGDTLKVVQNLPGVARSALGSGAIVVWGAAPRETKVNVDGVEIPALYHVGGLRSTVNGELVRSIDLVPGGYGADYGRGLGGLVKIDTRNLPERGVHGYAQADAIDASAMLSAAINPRLRIAVAARYSYLDAILGRFSRTDDRGQAHAITEYIPIPRYYDYQVHAELKLRRDELLEAFVLASSDVLRRSLPSDDPTEERSEQITQIFYRALLRYTRLLPDGASLAVTPSFGWDRNERTQQFGLLPVRQDSTAYRYGLRASYRRRLARFATLSTGVDLLGQWQDTTRSGSLSQPPREGDFYVFGRAPGDEVNADRWTNHTIDAAAYVFAELAVGKRLTITPGLRADAYYLEGDRAIPPGVDLPPVGYARVRFAIDPRLQILFRPHKRVSLTAAVGLYHQAPDAEDLSSVFGNPMLGLSQAVHVSLGVAVRITPTLAFEAVGFYKKLEDLPVRSAAPTPAIAQALTQEGQGRAYGGQFLLRQELWKGLFGWITYSVSRSERLDHPGERWRLFDYDQTHTLTAIASYDFRGWTFGARLRYSTGFPRSPVVGAYYDPRGDQYQPIFGTKNATRLPDFMQLDVRVDRTFTFRRLTLNVYLDAQNITARANAEEAVYNFDYSKRGYITGLPILATVGLRVQW
jgi:TonB family protein